MAVFGLLPHGADEPRAPLALQREDGEEIGAVQRDVELAVHRLSARLHVGDVEEMRVHAAGKTDPHRLAHGGMRAVAPGHVGRRARLFGAIPPLQTRAHTIGRFLETQKLRLALDVDAGVRQAIDQQALVLVLRKDQRIGKRAEARAHFAENGVRRPLPGDPEIDGDHLPPALDDRLSETDLAVKLERPRVQDQRA